MSVNHKPPRQDRRNVKRSPVAKHMQDSVGTKMAKPARANTDFTDPGSKRGTTLALLSQQGQFK
jgi:hypothetical protein